MNDNDEITLTDYWTRETTELNNTVDDAFREAQNHAYDLGLRRGAECLELVLSLALLKWGNLDPDANKVFETAREVIARAKA